MRIFSLILFWFSLLFSTAALADTTTYASTSDGNWKISRSEDGSFCTALAEYSKGDVAGFVLWSNGGVQLTFHDPRVTSLKSEEKVALELVFVNSAKNKIDDGWGTIKFDVWKGDDMTLLVSQRLNKEVLTDLARYAIWGLMRDDKVIESYNLGNSSEAVAITKRCIGWNSDDPFLK